jgi:hypothetical protein
MGEMTSPHMISVSKPEGKRLRGRPKHVWKDNITMDLKEVEYEHADWVHTVQDKVLWRVTVMSFRVP